MKIQFKIDGSIVNQFDYTTTIADTTNTKRVLLNGLSKVWSFTEDQYKAALDGRLVIGGTEIKLV